MISGLSESLTLTLVLLLVFGSVCLYLYTRLTHAEQKISLIESILLDLKMASDLRSFERASDEADDHPVAKVQSQEYSRTESGDHVKEFTNMSSESDSDYDEYKDVLQSARSAINDRMTTVNLDDSVSTDAAISMAPGSPAPATETVQAVSPSQDQQDISTDAHTSVGLIAPFEAADVPFESLDEVVGNASHSSKAPLPNLESLTAKELHAMAKQKGVTGESKMTRVQLIEELSK